MLEDFVLLIIFSLQKKMTPDAQQEGKAPTFKLTVTRAAEMRTKIPVARLGRDGASKLLVDAAGAPVWPIESDEDLSAITEMATVFSAETVEVPARAGSSRVGGSETVLGVGEVGDTATLYGHLTGRKVEHIEVIDELSSRDDLPTVIVHCAPQLDRHLIQLLALAAYDFQATGIIWGRTQDELRRQALIASCAASVNGPLTTGHLHLVGPDLGASPPNRSVDELRRLLSQGSGVLSVLAHSDGTSQIIDSTAVLCPRAGEVDADPDRGPECLYSGTCYLLDMAVDRALEERRMIGPDEVAARLFVNMGCHSAFLGNVAVDSRWSTLPSLVANPRVGAVLATPTLGTHIAGPTSEELLRSLEDGVSVGRALALFEANPTVRQFDFRMMLFGDPRVRGKPMTGSMIKRDTISRQVSFAREGADHLAGGAFAQALPRLEMTRRVGRYFRRDTQERGQHTSRALYEKVREFEDIEDYETAVGGPAGTGIRVAVLKHLGTTKARIWEAWQQGAYRCDQSGELRSCPHCGWQAHSRIIELSGGLVRENLMCPICSDVWDFDLGSEIRPNVQFPEVQLQNANQVTNWDGAVFVARRSARDTQIFKWPSEPDGGPAQRFSLDADLASGGGLVRVYAIFIDGLAIQSSCQPIAQRP